jgi:hypothetical protein
VDDSLVEEAVREVNRIYTGKGLETAREIGRYLLKNFFVDDFGVFESGAKEHSSFRALADRDDLRVSASFLWYAVKLQPQLQLLGDEIAEALPLSHHRLLLHVPDDKAKVRLAKRAVEKSLSKRQLEEEVRKLRGAGGDEGDGAPRGRPPLPTFVKVFNRLRKAMETVDLTEVNDAEIFKYGVTEARIYLEEVEKGLQGLAAVRAQLSARVAEIEARVGAKVVDSKEEGGGAVPPGEQEGAGA